MRGDCRAYARIAAVVRIRAGAPRKEHLTLLRPMRILSVIGHIMSDQSTILILGGPAAGKSVYLSVLYRQLWGNDPHFQIRAGDGTMHAELNRTAEQIVAGTMPPATQALRNLEFELSYGDEVFHLRSLDYPGELFRRVFFDLAVDSDEAREFYRACERASALIVLVDPETVARNPIDMDFALSNLFRYFDGRAERVAFVLAFTKRDATEKIVGDSVVRFVRRNLTQTSRLMKRGLRVLHFSSIIKLKDEIQFATGASIRAPLEAVIEQMAERHQRQRREAWNERLRRGKAMRTSAIVAILLFAIIVSFTLGIAARQLVESNRQ